MVLKRARMAAWFSGGEGEVAAQGGVEEAGEVAFVDGIVAADCVERGCECHGRGAAGEGGVWQSCGGVGSGGGEGGEGG